MVTSCATCLPPREPMMNLSAASFFFFFFSFRTFADCTIKRGGYRAIALEETSIAAAVTSDPDRRNFSTTLASTHAGGGEGRRGRRPSMSTALTRTNVTLVPCPRLSPRRAGGYFYFLPYLTERRESIKEETRTTLHVDESRSVHLHSRT